MCRASAAIQDVGTSARSATAISTSSSSSRAERGACVVKQALPYVRLVGESWPLPLKRSFFEYHALTRQDARGPGMVPRCYYFDESQALIVMEYLSPHVILRTRADRRTHAAEDRRRSRPVRRAHAVSRLGSSYEGCATARRDLALFADNVELCDITENLVFTDPYFEAAMNRHTSPQLDGIVAELRADRDLKVEAQQLKHLFAANAETLLHGDLHTGSIMVTDDETRVIDPEFAFYGPMAFDVGMMLANFWMAYFSQRGHETGRRPRRRCAPICLASSSRPGRCSAPSSRVSGAPSAPACSMPASLFEDRGDTLGASRRWITCSHEIWTDMLGFAGVEIHRRILGLAHNADFETIADEDLRAACETQGAEVRASSCGQPPAHPRHRRDQRAGAR